MTVRTRIAPLPLLLISDVAAGAAEPVLPSRPMPYDGVPEACFDPHGSEQFEARVAVDWVTSFHDEWAT